MLQTPFKEPYKIDAKFGEARDYGPHSGEDWNGTGGGNTDCGYKLYPLTNAEVVHTSEYDTSYGNVIVCKITGPWGERWIRYCHCREILVKSGLVPPEMAIATLGTTGNSTACHLHWDVIKKPMTNWRMYAKDQKTLDEYFEEPTAFFNKWKDVEEEEDMPDWLKTLLQERGLTINNESEIRVIFEKAKNYDDKIKELTEQVKTANDALGDKAYEVSMLTERVERLDVKVAELEGQLNQARSERDQATWENDKLRAQVASLEEKVAAFEENNNIYAYTWIERLVSLFKKP